MRPVLLILFLFCSALFLSAQARLLSMEAEISVLTIGPGKNLNDAFGHSAFRVKDPARNLDIAYNYGVYDFTAKHFYLKFAQGKLNYKIESDPAIAFIDYYKRQNRSVKEQVLNLNQESIKKTPTTPKRVVGLMLILLDFAKALLKKSADGLNMPKQLF